MTLDKQTAAIDLLTSGLLLLQNSFTKVPVGLDERVIQFSLFVFLYHHGHRYSSSPSRSL